MLKKILINGLFGVFNYEIKLNEDITIITAPNGYGKTFCLKIIHSIYSFNYFFLFNLNFKSITFISSNKELTVSKKVKINKQALDRTQESLFNEEIFGVENHLRFGSKYLNEGEIFKEHSSLEFSLNEINTTKKPKKKVIEFKSFREDLVNNLYILPHISRVDDDEWIDRRSMKRLDLENLLNDYDVSLPVKSILPDWLVSFSENTVSYFIQDQRLLKKVKNESRRENSSYVQTIQTYAKELKSHIVSASLKFSAISQELDSTFPRRLIDDNEISYRLSTQEDIIKELNELQNHRERLKNFDILPKNNSFDELIRHDKIEENHIGVLNLYIEDTKTKLSQFDDIYSKVNLFVTMLNAKLSFKKVKADADKGFYFIKYFSDREDDNDIPLSLSQLSSGEQHEVVLIYELIFNIKKGSLILIDEPEISLHVVWQQQFLSDLKKIMDINKSNVIIATHSPQIINNDWNKVVDLQDLSK